MSATFLKTTAGEETLLLGFPFDAPLFKGVHLEIIDGEGNTTRYRVASSPIYRFENAVTKRTVVVLMVPEDSEQARWGDTYSG